MTSQDWCPRGMLVLVVIARENFDSGHFELSNFPGRWLLRPAFLAGIKPCDVIMHKVYCHPLYNNRCMQNLYLPKKRSWCLKKRPKKRSWWEIRYLLKLCVLKYCFYKNVASSNITSIKYHINFIKVLKCCILTKSCYHQ
jgi:hypothetical protein